MASSNAPLESSPSIDTGEHRYEVAPDESPTEAVPTAVAEATGRPVTPSGTADSEPLPPLFETIDPDALDSLADPAGERENCLVTFTYAGCTVSVERQVVTVTTRT